MIEIAFVVAADENNGIGKNNELLCYLPNDLKFFKRITTGYAVLMGRKTYDSIGKPLPNRINLIVSRKIAFIDGCEVFSGIESAIEYAVEQGLTHLFVIGGDSVYKQSLQFCHKVYLTRIHHTFEADSFMVPLPENEWKLESSELQLADEKNPYAHTFEVYTRA
jgi:dihydrofolate reductase